MSSSKNVSGTKIKIVGSSSKSGTNSVTTLAKRITELENKLTQLVKEYSDILSNIDDDNLSAALLSEKSKYKKLYQQFDIGSDGTYTLIGNLKSEDTEDGGIGVLINDRSIQIYKDNYDNATEDEDNQTDSPEILIGTDPDIDGNDPDISGTETTYIQLGSGDEEYPGLTRGRLEITKSHDTAKVINGRNVVTGLAKIQYICPDETIDCSTVGTLEFASTYDEDTADLANTIKLYRNKSANSYSEGIVLSSGGIALLGNEISFHTGCTVDLSGCTVDFDGATVKNLVTNTSEESSGGTE